MSYPDILTALSGNKITSVQMWEKHRRDEIYTLFQNYVYGVPPIDKPEDLSFSVKTVHRVGNILQKKVAIKFLDYDMKADVFLPENNDKKLPAYLFLMHEYEILNCPLDKELDFEIVPIPDIISRCYAVMRICFL